MRRCFRCKRIARQEDRLQYGGVCAECYAIRMRELEVHGGDYSIDAREIRLRDRIKALEERLALMDREGVNVVRTPLGFIFSRELTKAELRVLREDLAELSAGERRAA